MNSKLMPAVAALDTQFQAAVKQRAVVTALLRLKGTKEGVSFDRLVWFSDTYLRTSWGWKYFFGQASLPLPDESAARP